MPKKQLIRQIPREKFRKGSDGKAARKGRDLVKENSEKKKKMMIDLENFLI